MLAGQSDPMGTGRQRSQTWTNPLIRLRLLHPVSEAQCDCSPYLTGRSLTLALSFYHATRGYLRPFTCARLQARLFFAKTSLPPSAHELLNFLNAPPCKLIQVLKPGVQICNFSHPHPTGSRLIRRVSGYFTECVLA